MDAVTSAQKFTRDESRVRILQSQWGDVKFVLLHRGTVKFTLIAATQQLSDLLLVKHSYAPTKALQVWGIEKKPDSATRLHWRWINTDEAPADDSVRIIE